jgi:uncharacterized alkaline shock family protein YloU
MADRVLVKIAAQAALEAVLASPGGSREAREVLGFPGSSVAVRSGVVRARVAVDLLYPVDVTSVASDVQRHVAERLEELTDLRVSEVVVVVAGLHPRARVALDRAGRVR